MGSVGFGAQDGLAEVEDFAAVPLYAVVVLDRDYDRFSVDLREKTRVVIPRGSRFPLFRRLVRTPQSGCSWPGGGGRNHSGGGAPAPMAIAPQWTGGSQI